ncbi:MAG: hypothetical protein R3A10_11265 [Caldilineaceae bacterium]
MPNKTIVALLFPVMCAAAIGFLLSAYVHVGSYAGPAHPTSVHEPAHGHFSLCGCRPYWSVTRWWMAHDARISGRLPCVPGWMQKGFYILFGYAILNFFASFVLGLNIMRAFSGHWMFFYGTAFAVLYSARHTQVWQRRCPLGHKVAVDATFCETCGNRLVD